MAVILDTLNPTPPLWAIVPTIDLVEMTLQTCDDLLAQSIPVRVLLIDQGSSEASNDAFRAYTDQHHPRVLLWSFNPPLPSLSTVWNHALDFVWLVGGREALVVNSDVRLHPYTAQLLQTCRQQGEALFITAVGVGAEQFAQLDTPGACVGDLSQRGGPDFSCFLVTQQGHQKYPFDEGFIPAFMEDCDAHRRYLLGGDGARIFSVNLPFHHIRGGSRTINQSPEARERFERQAGIGRTHYQRKWGGPPNQERFIKPFGPQGYDGVTLPELQARCAAGEPVLLPEIGVTTHVIQDSVIVTADRELSPEEEIAAVEQAFTRKAAEIRAQETRAGGFPWGIAVKEDPNGA